MKKQIKVTLIVIVAAIIAAAIIWYVMYLRGKEQDLLTPVGTRAEFIGDTDKGDSDPECRRRTGCSQGCDGSRVAQSV